MPAEYALELNRVRAFPSDRRWEEGIVLAGGRTQPFVVERSWAGPAGHYIEQWSIRKGPEVLYRSQAKSIAVRGMQSISTFADEVTEPLELEPGTYKLVFVVEGRFMGSADVEVSARDSEAA